MDSAGVQVVQTFRLTGFLIMLANLKLTRTNGGLYKEKYQHGLKLGIEIILNYSVIVTYQNGLKSGIESILTYPVIVT